LALNKYDLLIF